MKNYILLFLLIINFGFAQQVKRKLVWEENFNGKELNEKDWNIAKGNGILNSSVTSGCDLFYSIDFDNKVMISDNAILDFIKIINQ